MLLHGKAAASASASAQRAGGLVAPSCSSSRRPSRAPIAAARASASDDAQQEQQQQASEQPQQRPASSRHAGGEPSTSSSSVGGGGGMSAAGRRAFAAAASSLAVVLPGGIGGGGGGIIGGSGGGGGGGGWWGGWFGGGAGAGGSGGDGAAAGLGAAAAALYELAAAGDDDAKQAKKKRSGKGKKKKKAAGNIEDQDPDSIDNLSVGRPGPRKGKGRAGRAAQGGDLVTDDSEVEDALDEVGLGLGMRGGDGSDDGGDGVDEAALLGSAQAAAAAGDLGDAPRCVEVVVENWPEVGSLPRVEELRDTLTVQEGFAFDSADLNADAMRLSNSYREYLATVSYRVEPLDDGGAAAGAAAGAGGPGKRCRVVFTARPYKFDAIQQVEIRGATLMPQRVMDEITASVLPANGPYRVDVGVVDTLRAKIEKWYQSRGLPFCYVGYFDGMDEGALRANVVEAKVTDVTVRYRGHGDKPGGPERGRGKRRVQGGDVVAPERIVKASGFKKGQHYHIDDGQDAMNNIYACGLLEEVSVDPEQDPKDPSKIHVRINVMEAAPRSMELSLDWAVPLKDGVPQLGRQALVPGGSVDLTHENLFGNSESASLSLSSSDWRNPAADLGYTLSYAEPFYAPRTTRNAQVFNTRKMSPVFTPGGEPDVPPVFVDRFGCKAWTSHAPGGENKVQHALILQAVSTVDENGQPVTRGTKVQRGYYADNGPQTTLSGTGRDVSLSYQGFAALDTVQFVNGNQVGTRALAQVDQGLNLRPPVPGGAGIDKATGARRRLGPLTGGVYNRAVASVTRFMQLPGLPRLTEEDVWVRRKAPTTLVLHARAGAAVGDLASYDAFTLGGPYSVRGYAPGELGACRRFLELAAEVRYPLRNARRGLPGTAYAFVDAGSDLGSSAGVDGNPTEFYRKPGGGVGVGVGLRALGACRFEYARDCNAGTGAMFVQWGERF